MQKQQLYIQLIGNLIIPILGFWLWNWSLYFILLFYILDLFASEMVVYLKINKIKKVGRVDELKSPTLTFALISFLFLTVCIILFHIGILVLHPDINFKNEVWSFLTYKELGIQQWVLLFPLVVLMAISSFKMEFVVPKLFLHQKEKEVWKARLKEHFLLLSFTAILIFIVAAFQLSEVFILVVILVITTGYNYLQGIEKVKSFKQNITP